MHPVLKAISKFSVPSIPSWQPIAQITIRTISTFLSHSQLQKKVMNPFVFTHAKAAANEACKWRELHSEGHLTRPELRSIQAI